MKPIFTIKEVSIAQVQYRLVSFEIPGGITSPKEFSEAIHEISGQLIGRLPILLNGRGPTWGYGMLIHAAHACPMVATFDPRLEYVVVQSHDVRWEEADIVSSRQ